MADLNLWKQNTVAAEQVWHGQEQWKIVSNLVRRSCLEGGRVNSFSLLCISAETVQKGVSEYLFVRRCLCDKTHARSIAGNDVSAL